MKLKHFSGIARMAAVRDTFAVRAEHLYAILPIVPSTFGTMRDRDGLFGAAKRHGITNSWTLERGLRRALALKSAGATSREACAAAAAADVMKPFMAAQPVLFGFAGDALSPGSFSHDPTLSVPIEAEGRNLVNGFCARLIEATDGPTAAALAAFDARMRAARGRLWAGAFRRSAGIEAAAGRGRLSSPRLPRRPSGRGLLRQHALWRPDHGDLSEQSGGRQARAQHPNPDTRRALAERFEALIRPILPLARGLMRDGEAFVQTFAALNEGKRRGQIMRNPLGGFERAYSSDRSEMIWTEADIARFMASAPLELQQALIPATHTGQRYGHLIRLRWQDYDGAVIRFGAGGCLRRSKRMLGGMARQGPFILTRADGRPWHTERNDQEGVTTAQGGRRPSRN